MTDVAFKTGQYVVYPAHGVGVIQGIESHDVAGAKIQVVVVTFERDKMTVRLPLNKSTMSKVRALCSKDEMNEVIECLRVPSKAKKTIWSRRAQEYEAKITSGDPLQVAQVVRDLHRTANQPEHSYSERQLYQDALDRLMREYALVNKVKEDVALKEIVAALSVA